MTIVCKNCQHHFKGHYCYNCGQAAETHEINFHFLWHDIQHGLLHIDKGLAFTTRELFSRPGHTIREFLEGKRVKHFRPVSMVLVLAGVVGLLFHYFHIDRLSESITITGTGNDANHIKSFLPKVNDWISAHYAIVSLFQVPLYALGTWLAFRKARYNYVEHLVVNLFLTGQRLILRIVVFPIYLILNGSESMPAFGSFLNFVNMALTFWTFAQLFNTMSRWSVLWRTVLSFFIAFVCFIALVALGVFTFGPQLIKLH